MSNHGVFARTLASENSPTNAATSGIPFVIGSAPLSEAPAATRGTAGTPYLITSFAEAEAVLGYDDDWSAYTLCEVMYYHFKVAGCQPVIFLPLVPASEATAVTAAQVAAAVEQIDLCMAKFGIIPDLILAPGFSDQATVSAAMGTKIAAINGLFKGRAIVDITAANATAAVTAKNGGSYTKEHIVCWPMCKIGELKFHGSTVMAGRLAQTDIDNEDIPFESPSNKTIGIDGLCDASGNEIVLPLAQANVLNAAGICTALNFIGGWRSWGNYTAAAPADTDPANSLISVARMFDFVGNSLIKSFWSTVDRPMTRRLVDSIIDSANIWLDGLVSSGYLLGGRVEFREDDNPVTNLMQGIVKLHIYMTPPSPAQQIDFELEYDASYVQSALQG